MLHEFSMDIGWVHTALGRLQDVCGMCIHHCVCTTVNIPSPHTFLLSYTGSHNSESKISEIIFHNSFGHIVLLL